MSTQSHKNTDDVNAFNQWREKHGTLLANVFDYEDCFLAGVERGESKKHLDWPCKPEDAFEVWEQDFRKRDYDYATLELPKAFGGPRSIAGTIMKAAFLAGAEFGAASRSGEVEASASSERPEAVRKGPAASEGADKCGNEAPAVAGLFCRYPSRHDGPCSWHVDWVENAASEADNAEQRRQYYGWVNSDRGMRIPFTSNPTRACGAINPASSGTCQDETCFYLEGHALGHSWEHRHSCLTFREGTDLAVRAFCAYRKGHPGKHSWEEGQRADHVVFDEAAYADLKLEPDEWHFNANEWKEQPKPPLGVTPQRLWKEERIRDLARAIHEYCQSGIRIQPTGSFGADVAAARNYPVSAWIHELRELWETM